MLVNNDNSKRCYYVVATFMKLINKMLPRYTLQASTFQMAVLLQYNDADQWTMGQLAESTQIKKDILVQVKLNFRYLR